MSQNEKFIAESFMTVIVLAASVFTLLSLAAADGLERYLLFGSLCIGLSGLRPIRLSYDRKTPRTIAVHWIGLLKLDAHLLCIVLDTRSLQAEQFAGIVAHADVLTTKVGAVAVILVSPFIHADVYVDIAKDFKRKEKHV